LKKRISQNNNLPKFNLIVANTIKKELIEVLECNRVSIKDLLTLDKVTWDNFVIPLALLEDSLNKMWSPIRHLNSVKSSAPLREAYSECLPLLSEYTSEISQNKALYDKYLIIFKSKEFDKLNSPQKKTISNALRNFKLGGVDLKGQEEYRYKKIQTELSELESIFENNVLDATQSWEYRIYDDKELDGLPKYAKAILSQLAREKNFTGYRLTLDMPCYIAVISHADNRTLRENIYKAYISRASEIGKTDIKFDNATVMEGILNKRQEKAVLLGYSNYSDYSLETKMAESTEQVIEFLNDLAKKSTQRAKTEVYELQQYAESLGFESELQPWDFNYYSEKLKQQQYKITDEDLKPYFSDQSVIAGLFKIVHTLYNITIKEIKEGVDLWDSSVRFYQIRDQKDQLIGQFYLDLYARTNKRGGAWMDQCINRYHIRESKQIPVAYLICNLTPPIGTDPALFTHDEVITIFHEFGHGLHHMLTKIDEPDVAGINGVEWDAVELPSQFMENYCWQREALNLFAKHYETGENLPDELFKKLVEAKNFQSGLKMLRQVEFSLFDIKLHQKESIKKTSEIQAILDQVRNDVSVVKTSPDNRFQMGSHTFLQAVMQRDTTAINGLRFCPQTLLLHLKRKAFSIRMLENDS
jgi:oligopeptidase A